MKSRIYLVFLVLLALSVVFTTFGYSTMALAKVYTFKYAGYYPPDSVPAKNYEQYYMNKVTELSNKQILWQYFPASQMGPGTDQLDIVGGGAAEVGMVVPAFFTGKIPIVGCQDLPFLFRKDVKGHIHLVTKMQHQPEYATSWEKFKVKFVAGASMGTMAGWFKQPLTKLEDWKGRKIRTAGKLQSDAIKALGAVPQSLVSPEVYMALSTGVLDATLWHPDSALEYKIYEVAKNAVIPNTTLSGYTLGIVANMDIWNGLPRELQDAMLKAAQATEQYGEEFWPKAQAESIAKLKEKGVNIYYVPLEENDRWRQATRPVWDQWLKDNGEAGQRLLDFVLKELGEK